MVAMLAHLEDLYFGSGHRHILEHEAQLEDHSLRFVLCLPVFKGHCNGRTEHQSRLA